YTLSLHDALPISCAFLRQKRANQFHTNAEPMVPRALHKHTHTHTHTLLLSFSHALSLSRSLSLSHSLSLSLSLSICVSDRAKSFKNNEGSSTKPQMRPW